MIYTLTLNPAIDRELTVPEVELNKVLRSEKYRDQPGGKGINVSRMLANLGIPSRALGFAGGTQGDKFLSLLKSLKVDYDFIRIEGETRMNVSVVTEQRSNYLKVNEYGPTVSDSDCRKLFYKIEALSSTGDWWVLSGSPPPGTPSSFYFDIINLIQSKNGKVFFDSSGDFFKSGCKAGPWLVKPNIEEAEDISGIHISDFDDAGKAAEIIHSFGIQNVVISMGEKGALYYSGQQCVQAKAPEIREINPVGAGDALLAGFIWGLYSSLPESEALMWGVACGTVAAGLHGTSFGTREEVQEMKRRTVLFN